MIQKNKAKTTGGQPTRKEVPVRTAGPRERSTVWSAQPCGFSREEMRQIVLEMIG
jgi:hypothetical protein